jgi:F1F0 ATPase subunit 2
VNAIDWIWLVLALVAGIGLGLFYFGGLWVTVQSLPKSNHPALTAFGSFILRTGAVIFVFYLVMDGRVERLAVSMLGFILARQILFKRLARPSEIESTKGKVS